MPNRHLPNADTNILNYRFSGEGVIRKHLAKVKNERSVLNPRKSALCSFGTVAHLQDAPPPLFRVLLSSFALVLAGHFELYLLLDLKRHSYQKREEARNNGKLLDKENVYAIHNVPS
jgi:hypothetical protein